MHDGLNDPESCAEVWIEALKWYWRDCYAAATGRRPPDDLEAWHDLHNSRQLLANLCRPLDIDAESVANILLERLPAPVGAVA